METHFFQKWLTSYSAKMIVIAVLALMLLIPTFWIQEIINERINLKQNVENELKQQWSDMQLVSGPVLNIPVTTMKGSDENVKLTASTAHFLPEQVQMDVEIIPDIRYRGIYKIPVYESHVKITGSFKAIDLAKLESETHLTNPNEAYFSLGISDLRGIKDSVRLKVNQLESTIEPGIPDNDLFKSGITFRSDAVDLSHDFDFQIEFNLKGSSRFAVEALGKKTNVSMRSTWADPGFYGAFLPEKREINSDGFTASWVVTHLNRNFPQQWIGKKYNTSDSSLGVSLVLPVDHYQKAMRSVKYAILFIALNFIVFLFIEIRNRKRIHPVQYALVAFALLLFYTLLTALSEQTGFNIAFTVSAIAIISLVSWYAFHVLGSLKQALWISALQAGLYLFLFTILQLQQYALLMGSIGLFVILALIMKASQKINWYSEED